METKYYKQSEFNKFPWNKLIEGEFATNGSNFSFSKGGSNYPHGEGYHISFYDGSFRESQWELPTVLSKFIDWKTKEGKKEKLCEIRNLLGVS